jgi:hypothetical protein
MSLSDGQRKMYLDQINQARKKIEDIKTRANKDIAVENKKILDLETKLKKG